MHLNRSPSKIVTMGGSNKVTLATSPSTMSSSSAASSTSSLKIVGSMQLSSSTTSRVSSAPTVPLYMNSSSPGMLATNNEKKHYNAHHYYHHHHQHQTLHTNAGGGGVGGSIGSSRSGSSLSTSSMKRGKKQNWGTRGRAGMSFMIVIAFFAVFGLIILSELFMIDERSHSGMMVLRHGGNLGSSRLGDSMPDYDNVKDDYDLLDENLFSDTKLGFVQFQDNKLKIQDADNHEVGRLTGTLLNSGGANGFGIGAGGIGSNSGASSMPWGKIFPTKVEETLPHYPISMQPTDGSWQVVNGTRFKFFVFSAYYDRRDGAKLIRVVAATKTRSPERVWCRFWYLNQDATSNTVNGGESHRARYTSATVMARVKIIRENWNLKYSACFVLCPVRAPELNVPQHVSIVARLRAPPGNLLLLRNTDWDVDFATNSSIHNNSAGTSSSSSVPASSVNQNARLPTDEQIADKIAICVKPFHFDYDQALYLMEYLEFYSLLGVSHFTFYNHTIGPHATCVLQHYMSSNIPTNLTAWDEEVLAKTAGASQLNANKIRAAGNNSNSDNSSNVPTPPPIRRHESTNYVKPTINILPWNLRMRSQKEIRTEGLFAALNDCLYRTMYRYKYLALVDLDEFIVPRHNDTLNELINSLNGRFHNRNTGAYSFQNAFFYLQFPDDPLVMQNAPNIENAHLRAALVTQRKTRRRFKLHPQKQRSKYICKPEAVVEAGNHFVWEFAPGKGTLNVPPIDAILQHYRVCEFGGNDCIKAPSVIDRTATRYVNRLVQRVDAVYKYLKRPCDLPELPNVVSKSTAAEFVEKSKSSNEAKVRRETQPNNELKHHKHDDIHTVASIATATTTSTTTTMTTKIITMAITKTNATSSTTKNNNEASANGVANFKKRHKMVVFERDENGIMMAKVEYVYN